MTFKVLRVQLLAALGLDDDGHTALAGYIARLVDQRDQARSVAGAERNKAVAAAGQLAVVQAELEHARRERDVALRTVERLASDGLCGDQSPRVFALRQPSPCWLRAGHVGREHRAEDGSAWVYTGPDAALIDLRAAVRRLRAERDEARQLRGEAEAVIVRAQSALGSEHEVWAILDDYDGTGDSIKALARERDEARADVLLLTQQVGQLTERCADGVSVADYLRRQLDAATAVTTAALVEETCS